MPVKMELATAMDAKFWELFDLAKTPEEQRGVYISRLIKPLSAF